MTGAIVITQNVFKAVGDLSIDEKKAIIDAFTYEEILKVKRENTLSPYLELIYLMIKDYIMRDSYKYEKAKQDR